MAESRRYFDDQRREVAVEKGLGGLEWGVFRRRKNTRTGIVSLHRVVSPLLPMVACRATAERNLELYARHRKGWMIIPTAEQTRDMLLLVRSYEVPLARIAGWSDLERAQVCEWAGAVHLRASDNIVRVPETPALIAMLDRIHGKNG